MAGTLDLGSLTLKLAADVDALKRDMSRATQVVESQAKHQREAFNKVWRAMGGEVNQFAERIGRVVEGTKKMFGDNATAIGQKWGKELSAALGLTADKVKTVEQAARGLQGAFQIASAAVTAMISPVGVAVMMMGSLVLAAGAFKRLINETDTGKWVKKQVGQAASGLSFLASATGGLGAMNERSKEMRYEEMLKTEEGKRYVENYQDAAAKLKSGKFSTKEEYDWAIRTYNAGQEQLPKSALGIAPTQKTQEVEFFEQILKDLGGDFEALAGPIEKLQKKIEDLLKPGTSKAERAEAARLADQARSQADEAFTFDANDMLDAQRKLFGEIEALSPILSEWRAKLEEGYQAQKKYNDALFDLEDSAVEYGQRAVAQAKGEQEYKLQAVVSGQMFDRESVGGAAGNAIASNVIGGSRYASAASQGAAQGSAAGPWGAVVGGVIGLASQSSGFQKHEAALDEVLGQLSETFGKLFEAMTPMISLAASLTPVFGLLSEVFGAFGKVVLGLAKAIGTVQNTIIDALVGFLDLLPDWGPIDRAEDFLKGLRVDIDKLGTVPALDSLTTSTNAAADAMDQYTRSITNMPTGYKVEYAEYQAAANELPGWMRAGQSGPGGQSAPVSNAMPGFDAPGSYERQYGTAAGASSGSWWQDGSGMFERATGMHDPDAVVVGHHRQAQSSGSSGGTAPGSYERQYGSSTVNVTIQCYDVESIWSALKRLMQRDNMSQFGLTFAPAPAFFGQGRGGYR